MSETQQPQPEKSYQERLQDAWLSLEADAGVQSSLDQLCGQTLATAQSEEYAQYFENQADIRLRWQRTAHLTALLTDSPWGHRDKPAPEQILTHGLQTIQASIEQYGWVIPGISFKVLEEGFSWSVEQGKEPRESMFDVIDIRDLSDVPQIVTMTQEEYNALSEEQADNLRQQAELNFDTQLFGKGLNYSHNVPKKKNAFGDIIDLRKLLIGRRFGVPDREISDEEIKVYLMELIESRKSKDPSYADFPPSFDDLPQETKQDIGHVLGYFDDMRDPFSNDSLIDSYSLLRTIGFSALQVNGLVDAGVLQPTGSYQGPDGGLYGTYELTRPYHDSWWVNTVLDICGEDERKL